MGLAIHLLDQGTKGLTVRDLSLEYFG